MDIRRLRLSDFIPERFIMEKEFYYGDVFGFAELYGWQMIFFREVHSTELSAISMIDVLEDKHLLRFAKMIARKIGIDLDFGANKDVVLDKYGIPNFVDRTIDDLCRYIYLKDEVLISFSVDNIQGFSGLEIIQNEVVRSQRIDFYTSTSLK